jgi:integrase
MASIWKHPRSPFWMGCFTVYTPSPERWKRTLKTKDRKLAQRLADALSETGAGRLTEKEINAIVESVTDGRAKNAVRKVFGDVHRAATGREIGAGTFRAFVNAWLDSKQGELAPQSFLRYRRLASDFLAFIGATADRDLQTFSSRDEAIILAFRDALAQRLAHKSVNLSLKIVRQIFKAAEQRYKIDNPARFVGGLRKREHDFARRRAFTLPEIGRILREAAGTEWYGIILAGLYTGQRLGDVASLRWENVDLVRGELALTARKTNRPILIPLAGPIANYFTELPASDDPTAFVFPVAAGFIQRTKAEQTVTLSNQFRDLLARAGLVRRRTHEKAVDGLGRNARRRVSELSFHSFRHTATSLLKNAGVPQSVVMDIIGHESRAISQVYTHVGEPEKRRAVDALPSLSTLLRAGKRVESKRARNKKRKIK